MGKQRGHRSGDPERVTTSVNPLGKAPDDKFAGEVISQGNEKAKKDNTKR